ncbi:MAG: hypothetical protein ACM358_10695 [Gemmatimonadota bacterium]
MSPLAVRVGAGVLALLALFALRGKRWAYFGFVLLGLAYFPAQAHFHVHAPKCAQLLPTLQQLVPLLHNYAYIALFAGFYWISWVQFRDADARTIVSLLATLLAAVLVEVAQGMTARAQCHLRDLVPDVAGALGAALLLAIWARLRRKPAYVRLGKPRSAAAPQPVAPPPRRGGGSLPPRAVLYDPPAYAPPPPPPDFSPGPTTAPSGTPAAQAATTEEVAPNKVAARAALVQHLGAVLGRVRPALQRIWRIIWGRRRAIVVGVVLVVLVGAGVVAFVLLWTPTPVVTVQPEAPPPEPPPPPPRPLQSEVEGYYEPSYKFTVFDRRFTRLTLRPNPSVTFSRPGSRQEVACEDAQIGKDAMRLRCTLEPYGVVTIEGRFPSRYATSKLDMPVLSAVITVTNTRGEVQYRARDSFYWHVPD